MFNTTINDFNKNLLTYFNEVKDFRNLSITDEKDIWNRYFKTKNIDERNEFKNFILSASLKYVIHVAKKYRGRGISLSDLICEGNIGLCKAFDSFKIDKNSRFLTWAHWWIVSYIKLGISKENQLLIEENVHSQGTEIDELEIPIYHSNLNLLDNNSDLEVIEEEEHRKYIVSKLLSKLNKRERDIVIKTYGLDGSDVMKRSVISMGHSLTNERVRQILNTSLTKMGKK